MRATAPDMHRSRSLIQHCACTASISRKYGCLQLNCTPIDSTATQDKSFGAKSIKAVTTSKLWSCTYIAIWCTTMCDSKIHIPYDCMLCTKRQLYILSMMHCFIRTTCKWASHSIYLRVRVSFQLQWTL